MGWWRRKQIFCMHGGGSSPAQRLAAPFNGFYFAAPGAQYMTLSGDEVTVWRDLVGTGDATATAPGAFVDTSAEDYIAFVRASTEYMTIPYDWADGLTAATFACSFYSAGATSYNTLFDLYNGLNIAYYSGSLWVRYAAGTWYQIASVAANTWHALLLIYDVFEGAGRIRVFVDAEERFFVTTPTWPAIFVNHTNGSLCRRQTTNYYGGRIQFYGWAAHAFSDAEVFDFFDVCRSVLPYAASWTATGTTLIEHTNAELAIGDELALTATGLTVTAGTPVEVYDKGGQHVAFTTLEDRGAGVYRCYWRNGATHAGGDPTSLIQYSESLDSGATWGAPVTQVDTTGVDDRDPQIGVIGGVPTLLWVRYPSASTCQLFSQPVAGGAITNVFGYPQISGTQKVTSLAHTVDDGVLVVGYGGPTDISGWLACRVAGTDVYWTPGARKAGSFYAIYEPSTVRLASGDLLAVTRTGNPGTATGPVLQIRSTDDGVTWGSAQLFPASHGGQPLGIDAPALFQMSTGTLIVVGRRRYATNVPLTLLYSTDDGATWSAPVDLLNLVATDGGYCDMIEVDPTHLLISYYCQHNGTISQIAVVPVTVEVTP